MSITRAEYERFVFKSMKESTLLNNVLKAAKINGFMTAHFRPGLTQRGRWVTAVSGDGVGWPDVVLVRPPRMLFVECKTHTGRLSPSQVVWMDLLADVPGVETYVVRPADFDNFCAKLNGERSSK
jgi:hypothetical protein